MTLYLDASALVAAHLDQPARAVVIDATARKLPRALIWAELEYPSSVGAASADQTLVIHPGKNLTEGHRYIVALRDLRRADGSVIPAPATFAAYRDGKATDFREYAGNQHAEDEFWSSAG